MPLRIYEDVCPELAPFLRDTILERAAHFPSQGSNNVHGWKSSTDLFEWPEPEIASLRDAIFERFGACPIGWAMVNRAGSYHKRHRHGLTYQCGVYYVTTGEPAVPTIFEIEQSIKLASDRWTGKEFATCNETFVDPLPGRLVMFSGSTWHRVPIYEGTEPRISIALEVRP